MSLLTEAHRKIIGRRLDTRSVEVSRRDIRKYSAATEQRLERYLAGDEAPPMFIFNLFSPTVGPDRLRPDGLPEGFDGFGASQPGADPAARLPLSRIMAGGTELRVHRPIRPGDSLTGTRTISGLYEKRGRSGPLIFIEVTLSVVDADGEPVLDEIQTSIAR